MKLQVTHRTHYDYAQSAVFSQHLLRLTPRDAPAQRVVSADLVVSPSPDGSATQIDMFGNRTSVATVSKSHAQLEIVATSVIERTPPSDLIFEASAPWEDVSDIALGVEGRTPEPAVSPFAFPSQMTMPSREIEQYVDQSLLPGRPIMVAAAELSNRIHEDFEYLPGSTHAETLPTDSFSEKRGVCQDFAHVMLAALRARRVAARYVSGYLRTIPTEGTERLQGADASHAWVSVWDPALGWVDFDPTNDMQPGTDHVTLAWGRDYSDVSPVSGVVIGAGRQILSVGVDVLAV